MSIKKEVIREKIRKNYAGVALKGTTGGCCCSSGCCSSGSSVDITEASTKLGYTDEDITNAPAESNMGLGCGNPIAIASLKEGEIVLDLGSGGGFDCFLARKQVGDTGYVIGVDMTPEMIQLARKNVEKLGYQNVEFRLGEIEHLPVADSTIDVIISNCVINLSLDKQQVYKEAYRVLKSGGRFKTSDVVATAPLLDEIRRDLDMVSGCIGGAEYLETVNVMLKNAGFRDIRLIKKSNSDDIINSWFPDKKMAEYVGSFDIEAMK